MEEDVNEIAWIAGYAERELDSRSRGEKTNLFFLGQLAEILHGTAEKYRTDKKYEENFLLWMDLVWDVFGMSEDNERDRSLDLRETISTGLGLIVEQIKYHDKSKEALSEATKLCYRVTDFARKHSNPSGSRDLVA